MQERFHIGHGPIEIVCSSFICWFIYKRWSLVGGAMWGGVCVVPIAQYFNHME